MKFINNILNNSEIIFILWDNNSDLLKLNKFGQELTGYVEEELLGDKWINILLDEENSKHLGKWINDTNDKNTLQVYEGKIICRDKREIHVLWINLKILNNKGNVKSIISIGVDITKQKETEKRLALSYEELEAVYEELTAAEEELKQNYLELQRKEEELSISEERYRLALEGSQDAVWDWDIKRKKSFASSRWREMLGYSAEDLEINHLTWKELIHPDDKERAFASQQDHLNGKTPFYSSEYRLRMKNGEYKWIMVRGKALRDENGNPIRIAGSQTDITERKEFEEKINLMAYYDSLTGLPNRALLEKTLEESLVDSMKNNLKGAVFFLDLDNFKAVNDTYGHSVGDELLKNVADVLKAFEEDNIVISRFGGDEFVIMIHNAVSDEEVIKLAQNIVQAINRSWFINGKEFYITVSIGIVFYPDKGSDVQSILSNADCAMYSVKKTGKDNYSIYSSSMNSKLMEQLDMENSLRHALHREEFCLHYQPQINQKTGEMIGIEALIRWNHPTKGLIPPNHFIPMAEETGLIIPIGEWVLQEACRQNKMWQDMGYKKIPISVNLSALQIKQPNLIDKIQDVLEETGLEPQWLCLEVTESIAISDIEFAVKVVKDLKDIGISIALDDFGTGFSSLSNLMKLPINVIKIDRSFVNDINEDRYAAAITEAIIVMSRKMNINVIAEGVETRNQREFLLKENCNMAQGYLFSKPLPADGIEDFIKNKIILSSNI